MKKSIFILTAATAIVCMAVTCKKQPANQVMQITKDSSLVNLAHLDYLYIPITFPGGVNAAGIYIYANAPDYHLTAAPNEGYTCVDDVSRATLVYLRHSKFSTDTSIQSKTFKLINFLLEMQSSNGYFYNFLLTGTQINTNGSTSSNGPDWWSWRAFQTLTEALPAVQSRNATLAGKMDQAINKLVSKMKSDLVNLPLTTKVVNGLTVPEWLPAGSGTDQAAVLITGLISYCRENSDTAMVSFIRKLSNGIVLMQHGDSTNFPYDAFLSWENTWHAYGNAQVYALLKAGDFLHDPVYTNAALKEIDNFYPWLIKNGYKNSFAISYSNGTYTVLDEKSYEQIAYGIKPMVFASIEAFRITGKKKYADLAGQIAAWFLGTNNAGQNMYSVSTGRCYDGLSGSGINLNAGAESTIEALLTMERVEDFPAVKTALNNYKK